MPRQSGDELLHTRPSVVVAIGVGACLGATVGSGAYVAFGVGVRVAVGSGLGVGVRVASALTTIRYTPYGSLAGGSITLASGVG